MCVHVHVCVHITRIRTDTRVKSIGSDSGEDYTATRTIRGAATDVVKLTERMAKHSSLKSLRLSNAREVERIGKNAPRCIDASARKASRRSFNFRAAPWFIRFQRKAVTAFDVALTDPLRDSRWSLAGPIIFYSTVIQHTYLYVCGNKWIHSSI